MCSDSSILVHSKKLISKWEGVQDFFGGTGRKIGLNVEKWSFPRTFSRLSLTHQSTLFYAFSDQIHPSNLKKHQKVKKTEFLDKFQTVLSFLPSPYFGQSFKFYNAALFGHYRSYISQNFGFKTYAYLKLSRKNLRRFKSTPLGIKRVKLY